MEDNNTLSADTSVDTASTESADVSTEAVSSPTEAATESTDTAKTTSSILDDADALVAEAAAIKAKASTVKPGVVANAYQPTFKYKVYDQEKEFPEQFRGIVKDEASEKMVRDYLERADALDGVKKSRDQFKTKWEARENEYNQHVSKTKPLVDGYQKVVHFYGQAGVDANTGMVKNPAALDVVFKELGIPKKALYHWLNYDLNTQELPNEAQSAYNQNQELIQQNYRYQQDLNKFQHEQFTTEVQKSENLLSDTLSKPEINPIVSNFENKNGPGSFRDEVILRGRWYQEQLGVTKQPEEIVSEIVSKYNLSAPTQAVVTSPVMQAAQSVQPVIPAKPPVIPVIRGGGTSTVRKKPTTIEDVERAYQELP